MNKNFVDGVFIFLMVCLVLTGCAIHSLPEKQTDSVSATIVEWGQYSVELDYLAKQAPDTQVGAISLVKGQPQVLVQTDQITAEIDTKFGFCYVGGSKMDQDKLPVTIRVTHPQTVNPESGTVTKIDEWESTMFKNKPRFVGWVFDYQWELVPGIWQIAVVYHGKVIVFKDFEIVVRAMP